MEIHVGFSLILFLFTVTLQMNNFPESLHLFIEIFKLLFNLSPTPNLTNVTLQLRHVFLKTPFQTNICPVSGKTLFRDIKSPFPRIVLHLWTETVKRARSNLSSRRDIVRARSAAWNYQLFRNLNVPELDWNCSPPDRTLSWWVVNVSRVQNLYPRLATVGETAVGRVQT